MIYKAVDYWNSPSLEHYGVKGMRWGVRKAIERTGRVVRRAGGAVRKSATTIAGGLYRAGSAVRRFKNRRAIKSANSARIQRRISRMNNEELQAAVTRMDLVNKLRGGNSSSGKTLGDKVSDAIEGKIAKMTSEALETSVNSLLVGESPITGVRRKAKESIASSKASIAENRKKYMITKSSSSSSSDSSSSSSVLTPKVRTTPVSDLNKYVGGPYINRHALYHDDFLAHYGIKGMKWGVRHDRQRSGNKRVKGNAQSFRSDYMADPEDWAKIKKGLIKSNKVTSIGKTRISKSEFSLEAKQKKINKQEALAGVLLTAGSIPVTALGAVGGIYGGSSLAWLLGVGGGMTMAEFGAPLAADSIQKIAKQSSAERKEKAYFSKREKTSTLDKTTGLYKKAKEMTQSEDLSNVNPGYGRQNANYKNNCGLCTMTYDLRRRGYDVTAGLDYREGTYFGDYKKFYPKSSITICEGFDSYGSYSSKAAQKNLLNDLSSQKGSRGNICVSWPNGGGHSMAYEVDNKGKVSILDGQSNTVYKNPSKVLNYATNYSYMRLDNKKPNIKLMKKEGVIR